MGRNTAMMVTSAMAPTSRRRARFLSCSSSSLIDFAILVRTYYLTLPLPHHCGHGKKRSENDDFIIIGRCFTGCAPCRSYAVEFADGRGYSGARQFLRNLRSARTAYAFGIRHHPAG